MRLKTGTGLLPLIVLYALLISLCPQADAEEVLIPSEVFFYSPVVSVTGQSAVWINPAVLGQRQLGSLLIFTSRDNRIIRDYGSASTTRAMGMAYRFVNGGDGADLEEVIFALGGGNRTRIGVSYRYFRKGPGYLNKRHLWTAAILFRHNRNFIFGGRAENLNRGRINGERSDMRFVYGVAARAYRDLLTLTFDVDMTQEESLKDADFRTGLEIRPMPGMFVYLDIDNHSRFNVGFRLNFESNFLGHRTEFERTGKTYLSTSYIGSVKGRQASLTKPRKKTLMLGLNGKLPENPDIPFFGRRPLKFFDYIQGLRQAADDPGIDRLFLHIKSLKCGLGKTEELLSALTYFRSQGKPIYAFLSYPSNLSYMLASVADTICVPPVSLLRLTGLRAELKMYKGLMDKLGVEIEMERVDEYKSAAEPFIFEKPTEENRQQLNRWLDVVYDDFTNVIASNRGFLVDSIKTLIDSAPMASIDAQAAGLVDELMYIDEAIKAFADKPGLISSGKKSFYSYYTAPEIEDRWEPAPKFGVLIADGGIVSGKSGTRIGSHEMIGAVKQARYNPEIKGVLLRINSPGGDALAADLLWHEIEKLAEKKPVVISMGNVAASGGYYIAAVKSPIFANKNTLTGSIGVYGGKVNFAELYNKIGIYTETIDRGENASMYSTTKPFTDDQREQLKSQLWTFYRHFISKVSEVRPMSTDSVNALGRGQVWTGTEAFSNGLTDKVGGFYEALTELSKLSGYSLDDIELTAMPEKFYYFRNPFNFSFYGSQLRTLLGGEAESETVLKNVQEGNIFYRIPYDIDVE